MSGDREGRLKAARNAIAITAMEGGAASERVQEILQWWIDGVITSGEARTMMMEHVTKPSRKET
ncbi:hypothetical protein CO669_30000 [Bradyrhizobium sp. Y36]|nr:hypothetical protein CO669_30000 [Bradyrhizobium sp. Y36]